MEIGAVLFGAGRGERLRPLTDHLPKPGLPVLDVPLGTWALAGLTRLVPPVAVNASHLADRLVDSLRAVGLSAWEPVVESPEPYGTAGTLRALRDRVGDRIVTWNGDLITSLPVADLLTTHTSNGALATVAVTTVERLADLRIGGVPLTRSKRFGRRVQAPAGRRVAGFIDRRREDSPGARFLGTAVFEREALELLPDTRPAGLGETLLRTVAERGELAAHDFEGYWRDVGTPEQYLAASLDVLYGRAPAPPVPVPGDVLEVDGGRAYLGPRAGAAPGSLLPGAIVLGDAVVEAGATVTDSIVWPGSVVTAGNRVEEAIWFGGAEL